MPRIQVGQHVRSARPARARAIKKACERTHDMMLHRILEFYDVAGTSPGALRHVIDEDCVMRVNQTLYRGPDQIDDYFKEATKGLVACGLCEPVPRFLRANAACMRWQCIAHDATTVYGKDMFVLSSLQSGRMIEVILRKVDIRSFR